MQRIRIDFSGEIKAINIELRTNSEQEKYNNETSSNWVKTTWEQII
ncbi:hypothetical protein HYD72_02330 [Mycoplasmopsis bovis]|nr:hypothetical protein [Mycoplasmopsis bovis]QQH49316.1 hypothetical protein HYD72_02330 [Mycoplasmopsis bovis]